MTLADLGLVEAWAAEIGITVQPGSLARLQRFLDLLVAWNRRVRLTGERDPGRLAGRHVADSIAAASALPEHGLVVDIGSGGPCTGDPSACGLRFCRTDT